MSKARRLRGEWYVDGRRIYSTDRPGRPVCDLPSPGIYHTKVDAANAEFIVRAVNNHDDLIDALKRAAQEILRAATGKPAAHDLVDLHTHLKTVILNAQQ